MSCGLLQGTPCGTSATPATRCRARTHSPASSAPSCSSRVHSPRAKVRERGQVSVSHVEHTSCVGGLPWVGLTLPVLPALSPCSHSPRAQTPPGLSWCQNRKPQQPRGLAVPPAGYGCGGRFQTYKVRPEHQARCRHPCSPGIRVPCPCFLPPGSSSR